MKENLSSYFEDPEFQEALAKYEYMLEHQTSAYFDADELTDIAEYYSSQERDEDAEKVIEFALQLHPLNTDILIFKSRSLALKGKLKEAYIVANLIEDKNDREVKFLRADLLLEENRIEEADNIFKQISFEEDEKLETLLDIVLAYIDVNQETYAQKWLNQIAEIYDVNTITKENQRYRDVMCDFYTTFNHALQAIPLLRASLDEHPYSIQHWNELGRCYLQLDNFEEAHDALDFALAIDSQNTETLGLKAFCYRQSGNLQKACSYYIRLGAFSNNKVRPYLTLTSLYFDMRDYKSCYRYLIILLQFQSELAAYEKAELFCAVALCHAALKHVGTGDKYIYRAIALNEQDPEVRIKVGHYFLIEGKEEMAQEQFAQALEYTPDDERVDTLYNIATACFSAEEYNLAGKYFEEIVNKYPQTSAVNTYYLLILCYFKLKRFDLCLHYVAKIQKEIPVLYNSLGVNDEAFINEEFSKFLRDIKANIDLKKYL